ncbi:hypothetical protein PoB_001376100 [Plakobranchus ocellatus]|uniref:Uncharacterized protein n=1 Tax=Plakobranchus ocellatus TaxID=259542 RepID=A0AAV3YV03_9GAST|nr:hypothetical protein PoB_001376100 [Plakobranchus ocellatus]
MAQPESRTKKAGKGLPSKRPSLQNEAAVKDAPSSTLKKGNEAMPDQAETQRLPPPPPPRPSKKKLTHKLPQPLEILLGEIVIDVEGNSISPKTLSVENGVIGGYRYAQGSISQLGSNTVEATLSRFITSYVALGWSGSSSGKAVGYQVRSPEFESQSGQINFSLLPVSTQH